MDARPETPTIHENQEFTQALGMPSPAAPKQAYVPDIMLSIFMDQEAKLEIVHFREAKQAYLVHTNACENYESCLNARLRVISCRSLLFWPPRYT